MQGSGAQAPDLSLGGTTVQPTTGVKWQYRDEWVSTQTRLGSARVDLIPQGSGRCLSRKEANGENRACVMCRRFAPGVGPLGVPGESAHRLSCPPRSDGCGGRWETPVAAGFPEAAVFLHNNGTGPAKHQGPSAWSGGPGGAWRAGRGVRPRTARSASSFSPQFEDRPQRLHVMPLLKTSVTPRGFIILL